jgi:hypothetical protein
MRSGPARAGGLVIRGCGDASRSRWQFRNEVVDRTSYKSQVVTHGSMQVGDSSQAKPSQAKPHVKSSQVKSSSARQHVGGGDDEHACRGH